MGVWHRFKTHKPGSLRILKSHIGNPVTLRPVPVQPDVIEVPVIAVPVGRGVIQKTKLKSFILVSGIVDLYKYLEKGRIGLANGTPDILPVSVCIPEFQR